jgi:glutathione S-transferase
MFGKLSLSDPALTRTVIRLDAHSPDLEDRPLRASWVMRVLSRATVSEWLDEARTLPHPWFDNDPPDQPRRKPCMTRSAGYSLAYG